MTGMVLKWAFSKPVTVNYPFSPRRCIEGSRGSVVIDLESCVFCGVCGKKCPTGALLVQRQTKRWGIDRLLCISCGACVEICPKKSLSLAPAHMQPSITKDRELYCKPAITPSLQAVVQK